MNSTEVPVSEWSYVIAAYALTWVTLLGYGLMLLRRLRRAAEDLAALAPSTETETMTT